MKASALEPTRTHTPTPTQSAEKMKPVSVEIEEMVNDLMTSTVAQHVVPDPTIEEMVRILEENRWCCLHLSDLNKDLIKCKHGMQADIKRLQAENAQVTSLNEALQVSKVDMNIEMDRLLAENDELRLNHV